MPGETRVLLVDISVQIGNNIISGLLLLKFTQIWLHYETKSNSTHILKTWVQKPQVDWIEQVD